MSRTAQLHGHVFDNWPPDNSGDVNYPTWPPTPGLSRSEGPTPTQAVGPYSAIGLPYEGDFQVAGECRPGVLTLSGSVYDGTGRPIADALLELWQADENGDFVEECLLTPVATDGFRGFGRTSSTIDGEFTFRTVKPGPVWENDGVTAPCVALTLQAGGLLKRLMTRVYFADEAERNEQDAFLSSLPADRRTLLVAEPTEHGYRIDIHLQGDHETPFLNTFTAPGRRTAS